MPDATGSRSTESTVPVIEDRPELTLCESRPGKAVLFEAGNSDGWIASDVTVDIRE
ncbi:hypothetical protein [Natronomonas sp.]|uniref:hypothetical protein n=1 Tax=Natronomonas sp. TaxID=2184060 RepID=UPI002FC28937